MAKAVKQYGGGEQASGGPASFSAEDVDRLHDNDDVDARAESHHHTLGADPNQASPGAHTHDGGTSPLLLTDYTITGSRSDGTALTSIIACLVRLGAQDSSTT